MISIKELEHMNAKNLKNLPNPGDQYCSAALDSLATAVRIYEEYYKGRTYTINFSDGSEITFEINPGNLSHMLGIDTQGIKAYYESIPKADRKFKKLDDAILIYGGYNILKSVGDCQSVDEVLELCRTSHHTIINFYRVMIRCEAFNRFSNFLDMDFGCINYDNEIAVSKGFASTNMKSRKFLFVESNEKNAPYFMLGIAYSEDGKPYIETTFASVYNEDLFSGQSITLPTSVTVESKESLIRHEATAKQKLAIYRNLKDVSLKYNCIFNIYDDYQNNLARNASQDTKQSLKERQFIK